MLCRIVRRRYAAWRYRCASESANAGTKNANKRKTSSATQARGIIATRTGDVRGRGQGHAPAQGHAVTEEGGQCRRLIITHAVSFCINGLERLVSEMTYVCVDGMSNPAHSVTPISPRSLWGTPAHTRDNFSKLLQ